LEREGLRRERIGKGDIEDGEVGLNGSELGFSLT
jgi:hypothetical protein